MKAYTYIPLLSLLLTSIVSAKTTIVVNPDGPITSLEAARQEVRKLKQQNPGEAIEVQIRGGLYPLRNTVVFGTEDSGTKAAPIVYKAYPGETPVFTGGVEIDGWKKVSADPAGVSDEAKGKLWVAEIPKGLSSDWRILSLYDGETLLKRARSGSFKYADVKKQSDSNRQGKKLTSALDYEGEPLPPFDRTVHFRDNDLRDWSDPSDIELILKDRPWLANIIPLERIDLKNKIAYLAVDPTYQSTNPNNRYWVENAIDHLDEPGEWVVNTREGRIYMWPEKDLSEMQVIAPYLQEFIRVEGQEDGPFAQHIHFEGLTFTHGVRDSLQEGDKGLQHDWEMYDKANAVVRFRFAEDCKFERNNIKASSGTGIRLDLHCQRIEINSNLLEYLGGCGIVLSGYGPGTKDVNMHNVVHDNYIHHIGELLWHSSAIFIAQSGHNEITHNTIRDLPYNGITVSGCRPHEFYLVKRIPFRRAWVSSIRVEECEPYIKKGLEGRYQNRLEYFLPLLHARENKIMMNEISRVLLKMHDGNAIYFSAMGVDNRVERNYMHQNYGTRGNVRLDDNPSFVIIRENVITDSEQGLGLKGPADVFNNFIFTETFLRGRTNAAWVGGTKQALPKCNIFMPPADSTSSNGLFLTDDRATNKPFYENLPKTESSIYFTRNTLSQYVPKSALGTDLYTGQPVTPGKDTVKLLYADPMFDEAAAKRGVYRFKPGSPAEKLGIQALDLREVGSSLTQPEFGGLETRSVEKGHQVLFEFKNKTPFDQAGVNTSMTVDGVTITTVGVIDVDGVSPGSTTNIHFGMDALGVASASGQDDGKNFDVGEAWVFQFDEAITSLEMTFRGLDQSENDVFTLSFPDGADEFSLKISGRDTDQGVYSLARSLPAGTPFTLRLSSGNIAQIKSLGVTTSDH